MLKKDGNTLVFQFDAETLRIEPWGDNSLRVRAVHQKEFSAEDWALTESQGGEAQIVIDEKGAEIRHGKIRATITKMGWLRIYNQEGKELLREYCRTRRDIFSYTCSALEVEAREFRPIIGGDFSLTARFESLDSKEKIFGMGMYQQPNLNLKGSDLELAHRNSQASVPFFISSLGYGFLWNNPAVGRAVFGRNIMTFEACSTKALDYWVTAGDTPAEIVEAYAKVTGTVPMMPEYGLGFWQCKLRYQTQEELLQVAREYKKRELPISVIVVDFFHWEKQGDWSFDPVYWPDPDAMIRELKEMGIELMVSVWPTVERGTKRYYEMLERGYLIRTERGIRISMDFQGNTVHFDATNPASRQYIWDACKQNYYDKGVRLFWLDEAEPEYSVYDFDNYRYYLGPNLQIGNCYPAMYAKAFFDGMRDAGQENVVNLLRCAWAGSQRYGALVWSGDIHSSFESLRNQFAAGLNMGIAGIPWFTTDIGGFHGGNPHDPRFQELLVRWFQYGAFCPVMRLHGCREPIQPQVGTTGGATCRSGADNEIWSFGEEAYEICKKYLLLRERLKPYLKRQMEEAHHKGTPVMRPLFYDFPQDEAAWGIENAYLFGRDILVAPVMYEAKRQQDVYLPMGCQWTDAWNGTVYEGGQTVTVHAPLERIPVFLRDASIAGIFI